VSMKPLQGIKVVELSMMVAGATCARMLADWGADVIKVEDTGSGDGFRKWPATVGAPTADDYNPLFDTLNANKRAISIDLKADEGKKLMYKLLEGADVFLTNVRTKGLERMGLDYSVLKEKFPKLVMAQLTGYGEKGPDKDKPGYDNVAFWARGGFMYSQAIYDSDEAYPMYMPMGFGDTACAMAMMAGISSALLGVKNTGRGDRVTISLYGTAAWMANILITGTQFGYKYPKTRRLSSPFGAPYKCKDGRWFMPQVVTFNRDAPIFYRLIGVPEMAKDPVYMSRPNFNKEEVCAPVIKRFEQIFATKTSREWEALFNEKDLCCEILATYEEVLEDRQAIENDYVYVMKYKNGKEVKLIRDSICSDNVGLPEYNPGPMHGEHTVSIMKDLGYGEEAINSMLERGVVKQHE
jgi:crotonobetainyl-CoA:carnitine CoA-transferase CaiB-like acyl-CoA transferase